MQVYLVQHGEALAKEQDPARPLTEQGRQDVQALAEFLLAGGLQPGRIVHSGKTRARQTAEILAHALLPQGAIETAPNLQPLDPVMPWVEEMGKWSEDTMLVGHQPFMGRLAAAAVIGSEDREIAAFVPGTVVCLISVEQGVWSIAWMLRPELFQ